jgi:hypothetical protein
VEYFSLAENNSNSPLISFPAGTIPGRRRPRGHLRWTTA